jgi:predicted dehydrogenase
MVNYCVVGAGSMGRNHIRVLQELGMNIIAVVEPAPTSFLQEKFAGLVVDNIKNLEGRGVDAAIVSTPSTYHQQTVEDLSLLGIKHLLVEKPALINSDYYLKVGMNILIGYIELFNPVVETIDGLLKSKAVGDVRRICSSRIGGNPRDRLAAKNVIWDLAVHDIQIVERLLNTKLELSLAAYRGDASSPTTAILSAKKEEVLISFEASWDMANKKRVIEIYGSDGCILADLARQEVRIKSNEFVREPTGGFFENSSWSSFSEETSLVVEKAEPLKRQLEYFDQCCNAGRFPKLDTNFNNRVMGVFNVST